LMNLCSNSFGISMDVTLFLSSKVGEWYPLSLDKLEPNTD